MSWLQNLFKLNDLGWQPLLVALGLFLVTSVGGLAITSFILVRLPKDYFLKRSRKRMHSEGNPYLYWAKRVGKNVLGAALIIVGIATSIPGIPGPGLLTILIGLLLMDYPGKFRFERWLITRPKVLSAVNRLRQRYGRPAFEVTDKD